MTPLRSFIRRFGSAVTFASALLLVGTLWVVGTHHHDAATEHTCAVCTTAHAPGVVCVGVASIAAPRMVAIRVIERVAQAPASIARGIASSRAPPPGRGSV
jgi:hypothetical protein